ncbi:hypothetical protein HC762_00650 [bacterium]|nr:hypothetical protein [bacterium]
MPPDNAFSRTVLTFSLNRREDEFDSKRAWDDFLEMREEMVMNLVLKTDVKKTEAALNRYKEANMDVIRANAALERKQNTLLSQRPVFAAVGASNISDDAEGSFLDPSGLVKGLRRVLASVPEKAYEPFMGMATTRDYYELRDNYPSIRLAKAQRIVAPKPEDSISKHTLTRASSERSLDLAVS